MGRDLCRAVEAGRQRLDREYVDGSGVVVLTDNNISL
jgi:hypothetical protein